MSEVIRCQETDGSWHEPGWDDADDMKHGRATPLVTAHAVNALATFFPERAFLDQELRALEWLCKQQRPDGSWAAYCFETKGDFWSTLAVLGTFKQVPSGEFDRYAQLGEKWLLSQQLFTGAWHYPLFPGAVATVLALEYFSKTVSAYDPSDKYTGAAVRLVARATDILGQSHSEYADRVMAIFAMHHGLEFFVYGVLQLPDVGIDIFKSHKETLGLGTALGKLRDHLIDTGRLGEGKELRYRSQITEMINDRDNAVHKAGNILIPSLEIHLTVVKSFISLYSTMLVGRDLLK